MWLSQITTVILKYGNYFLLKRKGTVSIILSKQGREESSEMLCGIFRLWGVLCIMIEKRVFCKRKKTAEMKI